MDTKKNMSREQLLCLHAGQLHGSRGAAGAHVAAGAAEGPGAGPAVQRPAGRYRDRVRSRGQGARVRRKLDSILVACPAPNSPRSGNLRRWRWSLRIIGIRRRRCRRRSGAPLQASGQHPARVGGGLCRHGRAREIVLPDSTHVWLNAGTKLIYPKQFNRLDEAGHLSGEMFADVRRDEDRRSSSPPTGWR